jgi:AcrR family transcriptional regulator
VTRAPHPKSAPRAKVESAADGRVRRGERSRHGIVSALFELIGEGVLQPTAQQVADRARVGIRSVFRHFSEMESLYAEMDTRLETEALALLAGDARTGSLESRVRGLARQRVRLFERVAPFKRASNLQRWRSSFLRDRHENMQRRLRADLRGWLPELRAAPSELVEAVDLATSFEAWDRLRGDRALSQQAVVAVIERMVRALLRDGRAVR